MALHPGRQTLLRVYNDLPFFQMSTTILGQKPMLHSEQT
jgi:hypothetical protein